MPPHVDWQAFEWQQSCKRRSQLFPQRISSQTGRIRKMGMSEGDRIQE